MAKMPNGATKNLTRIKQMKNGVGKIMRGGKDIKNKWKEYFERQLNEENKIIDFKRVITPVYKDKDDIRDCGNYRGIKLISHTMERITEKKL